MRVLKIFGGESHVPIVFEGAAGLRDFVTEGVSWQADEPGKESRFLALEGPMDKFFFAGLCRPAEH